MKILFLQLILKKQEFTVVTNLRRAGKVPITNHKRAGEIAAKDEWKLPQLTKVKS